MPSKTYDIAFQIGGKLQASLGKSMTTAAGQLDAIGRKISSLEKAQGDVTRFRALKNEISDTSLKLRQAEGEVRHLGAAIGPMTASMARQFGAAQSKVEALRMQFRAETTDLKGVVAAMNSAGASSRTLAADQARMAASLAKAHAAQKSMRENLGARAANKTQRDDVSAKLSASKGRVIAAAAGVAAWILPVKITADFEDSMVRAGALAKATDGQLAELTDTARKLGRDTRFSATQAATGMQYLAQSGFKVNEVLAAMPGMLDIAAAGHVELGEAADITSNILRGFGMQAGESGRLGDVLTNTFTNSSTTLSTLGETLKYVAPVAKSLGVSLESTAAAAGLLGTAGIKGEQAGTGLRAVMLRLAAPLHKGGAALASLGVKTMDAHKNLRPLGDILTDLHAKMAKLGTGARASKVKDIFGLEAATAATVLLDQAGSGNLQRFTALVGKSGTAAAIAAKQNATMAGQWDNLYGSVEDVAIQIGTTLIPTLKSLIDKMVPVINSVTSWLQKNPELTDSLVLGAAALSVLVLGLTVGAIGFNAVKIAILSAQGAMLLMNAATWKAAGAWLAANAAILLTVAAIGGLIYIGYQLYKDWDAIEDWWDGLWDGMFDKVASVVNSITPWLRSVGMDVSDMSTGVMAKATRTKRVLNDFDSWGQNSTWFELTDRRAGKAQPAPAEVPSWLTPNPKFGPPRASLAGADKLSGGSGRKRMGDITYSPNITVAPGGSKDARAELEKGLSESKKEFERMMRGFMQQQDRVSDE